MDNNRELAPMTVLGLMSGTSCDGLDIAACTFSGWGDAVKFKLLAGETYKYSAELKVRLRETYNMSGRELRIQDIEFARYIAERLHDFCKKTGIKPDIISSHGHTVFHDPSRGITLQIGCGATIAALTGITTVCDFRQGDVTLNGQGAPLVPIGDGMLFGEYAACLNLGGYANVSLERGGRRIAYDICALNVILNKWANKLGFEYDEGGKIAASHNPIEELIRELDALEYYKLEAPKSLSTEWTEKFPEPVLRNFEARYSAGELISSYTIHAARQIASSLPAQGKVLITGGGTWNSYLTEKVKEFGAGNLVIPKAEIVDFKEAIVFGLLGYLRMQGKENTMDSVTGALRPISSGGVYRG